MKQVMKALSLAALFIPCLTLSYIFDKNNYTFHVGPNFNFARYKFGNLSKTEGYLAGIHADMIHKLPCNFSSRLRFDGRWNAGYIAGINERKAKIKDYRPELNIGYKFSIGDCKKLSLMPFTGIGLIFLSSTLSTEEVTRNYYNLFVPLGAQLTWKLHQSFDIGLAAEYRIDTWSRFKITTPNIGSSNKIKLKRTEGLLIELPLTWHYHTECGAKIHTKIVPLFDWNRFSNTKAVNENNIPVPASKLQQWYLGLHADIGLHF